MKTVTIDKNAFRRFVDEIIKQQRVIGVCAKGDRFDFDLLESADQLRLDYDVTLQPPKKYFLPPVETLLTFEVGDGYKSVYDDSVAGILPAPILTEGGTPSTQFVLLGVHPYDMVALNQLDKLFTQDNYDTHYMKRRHNATIVVCDVVSVSKNVFASSMGTATIKDGFDVLLTDIGNAFVMESGSKKGDSFIAKAQDAAASSEKDLQARHKIQAENEKRLNNHKLKCEASYLPKLLEVAYDHPVWEEKAKTCFSCGSCNLVCPTCYCFNVQDDVNWDFISGKRERAWDGCLLDGFTKVAGEHEFRKKRADRFRHRLYRKCKYVPEKIGSSVMSCVGCGRCVGACLPDIANPVKVYNRLVDDLGIK